MSTVPQQLLITSHSVHLTQIIYRWFSRTCWKQHTCSAVLFKLWQGMGLTNKKVNCNLLPHHLSSHTENFCYKKCRHKDFTSESYRAYTWRQCESAGHNSRSRLNMFFVQMFAGISLLAFQFGIVCTCNCFLLLEYMVYIRMEHLITFKLSLIE